MTAPRAVRPSTLLFAAALTFAPHLVAPHLGPAMVHAQDFEEFVAVPRGTVALVNAKVYDGTGAPPMTGRTIIIEGNRITAVGATGSVDVPDDARVRVFRLQPESLVAVQAFLDQLQAEWRTQLRSFKKHAEGKSR